MPEFIASTMLYFAPLLIIASGALFTELSGRVNMAIEGQLLLGSFIAATAIYSGLNPLLAVLLASSVCAIFALGLSLAIDRFRTDPILAGLAANLVLLAAVSFFSKLSFGTAAVVRLKDRFPLFQGDWGLSLFNGLFACAFFIFFSFYLRQSRPGLRLRAVGSQAAAARAAGIDPAFYRALSFSISGLASGLAGALLCLNLSAWAPGMTGGKGWIGLAAMYLSRNKTSGLLLSCLVFSLAESAANLLQGQQAIPQEWSFSMPYIITLILLALVPKKGKSLAGA